MALRRGHIRYLKVSKSIASISELIVQTSTLCVCVRVCVTTVCIFVLRCARFRTLRVTSEVNTLLKVVLGR